MKNNKILKRIIILTVTVLFFLISCSEKKETLLSPEPYSVFIEDASGKICSRMLTCYRKMYRTVSPERQKEISPENCRSSALHRIDEKLALHTDKMKLLSVMCYAAILDADCDQLAVTALWNPACLQLRDISNRAE